MTISPGDKFLGVLTSTRVLPLEGSNGIYSIIDATIKGQDIFTESKWDYWNWLCDMEEQGYLLINIDKKKVFVEGPFLCRSSVIENEIYLCGARTPDFMKTVEKISNKIGLILTTEQSGQSFPSRICVKGKETNLKKFAKHIKLSLPDTPNSYNEALREICLSDLVGERKLIESLITDKEVPSISAAVHNISESFNTTDYSELNKELSFFNPKSLMYDGEPPSQEYPYCLGKRIHHGIHDNLYRLADHGSIQVCTDISKRYAKYFCLSKSGVKLGYNKLRHAVLVPKFCRLPLCFARVLTLCECKPAREITLDAENVETLGFSKSQTTFLEFSRIPEVMVKIIKTRLNMPFQEINYQEDRLLCKTL